MNGSSSASMSRAASTPWLRRLLTLVRLDLVLALRHKLVHVTLIVAAVFGALLGFALPEQLAAPELLAPEGFEPLAPTLLRPGVSKPPFNASWIPILFTVDLCILGHMFAAVMVLQDKQQGLIQLYRVSPGGAAAYVGSKLIVGLGLTSINLVVLVGLAYPRGLAEPWLYALVLLTCGGMTLLGIGLAVLFRSFAQYFYPLACVGLLAAAPMFLALEPSAPLDWTWWLPTYHVLFGGEALLFEAGAGPLDSELVRTALAYELVFFLGAAALAGLLVHTRLLKERA